MDVNFLSVIVKCLCKKIEDDVKNFKYIIIVFGIGYMWSDEK